jgi:hypothetical protein
MANLYTDAGMSAIAPVEIIWSSLQFHTSADGVVS